MARFRSSAAPNISGFSGVGRSGGRIGNFEQINFDPGSTNAGSAANIVNVGQLYGELSAKSPDYDEIAYTGEKIRHGEQMTALDALGKALNAGITAAGQVEEANEIAKTYAAQEGAVKKQGAFSLLGSIASAAIPLAFPSDETMKDNIQPIEDALATLRQLKPVTFHYKPEYNNSPERMHHGFIAQEYQTVLPDATYRDESNGKLCIDTNDLIGLLVRANQQLETRIARLEAKQALTAV